MEAHKHNITQPHGCVCILHLAYDMGSTTLPSRDEIGAITNYEKWNVPLFSVNNDEMNIASCE